MVPPMTRPADLASGAPDEPDALRRAERLFDAGNLGHLDADALHVARLACQRAPYLATLLIRDPDRLFRVAADPYLRREKPYDRLAAEVVPGTDLKATIGRLRGDELVRLGVRELERVCRPRSVASWRTSPTSASSTPSGCAIVIATSGSP
jgi:hypothetical protein